MLLRWRAGGSPRLLKASRTTYYALAYAHSAARPSQSLRKSQFKKYPVIRDSMRVVLLPKRTLTYHALRCASLAPSASRTTYHALRYASLAPCVPTIKGSPIIKEVAIQGIPSNISNILLKQQPITALSFFYDK